MRKKALLILPLLLLIIINPATAFAMHKPEVVKWQLIYLTGNPACSNYDYQMTNTYDEITEKYMAWYKLENSKLDPKCVAERTFSKDSVPSDLDLLIFVYERSLGRSDLNSNQVGGVFFHAGGDKSTNHVILFCDCPNFDFSDPVWILSHELSHFILYYKGYGPDIVEDMIHNIDSKYDFCVETHQPDLCKDIKGYLRIDSQAYNRVVMIPYLSEDDDLVNNLPSVNFMQKYVTNFWMDGKISDEDYLTVMGYDIEHLKGTSMQASDAYFDTQKKFFTDGPKDKKMQVMLHEGEVSLKQEQVDKVLANVPSKFLEVKEVEDDGKVISLPEWYKNTASMWLDRKITDNEYFTGMDYLFKMVKRNLE